MQCNYELIEVKYTRGYVQGFIKSLACLAGTESGEGVECQFECSAQTQHVGNGGGGENSRIF